MQPKRLLQALASPNFIAQWLRYRGEAAEAGRQGAKLADLRPMLNERTSTTGFDTHYVYHTGWASRVLARTKPEHHIDIGSSLFFVSNASAFVPMTHYDYRPPQFSMPGSAVGAADLLKLDFASNSILSLSCMHVIEHIGLGRYGDPINASGDVTACAELMRVLAPGGQLLFVTPVGKPSVHFNAHRVYGYADVIALFPGLTLEEFGLVTDKRDGAEFIQDADPARVAKQRYGCGCFLFRKTA